MWVYFCFIRCRTALPRSVRWSVWLGLRLGIDSFQSIKPNFTNGVIYLSLLYLWYVSPTFSSKSLDDKSRPSRDSSNPATDPATDPVADPVCDLVKLMWYKELTAFIALAASSSLTQLWPSLVTQSLPTTLPLLSTTSSSVTKSLWHGIEIIK